MKCPLCNSDFDNLRVLYEVKNIPIFQNKVYYSEKDAKEATVADISLMACENCDYVFNSSFDNSFMHYDEQYQNEQTYSPYFQNYLDRIVGFLEKKKFKDKKILEIGCGKGFFLEKLWDRSFEANGFDPAYEGTDNRIVKDYFSEKYSYLNADLIILRHTLEHIHKPLDFLHSIAKANKYRGMIYIEVPCLEWIIENQAFWDIFFEHCNYFTVQSLGNMFDDAEQGLLFNDQYMYVLADLKKLRNIAKTAEQQINITENDLGKCIHKYKDFVQTHKNLVIWGGGAKGSTFVNLTDPFGEYIKYVIDISPQKQNKYIAKTGHKIVSPDIIDNNISSGGDILIMNENYYHEIEASISSYKFKLHKLEAENE